MLLLMLLLACGRGIASAAMLLAEDFNYPSGPLCTVSAGLWNNHSGTHEQVMCANGRAVLRSTMSEDVNVLVPEQPFAATDSTVLYAGFTVNFSALPSTGGTYFAHFKGAGTANFRAKLFALTSGAATGKFRLGLANSANNASVTNVADLALGTDYRVYLRYVINTGTATLWLEPESEASPSVTAADAASSATLTSFALREDSGMGTLALDELRIGTSFADVYTGTNIIPPSITQQPVAAAAIEGGAVTFVAAATGTAPLQYQWKFNDLDIPAATNAILTLSDVTTNAAGEYRVTVTNPGGVADSVEAMLTVIPPNASGTLTLAHYNVKGNFASDWSTNAAQVQAIARQLRYLNPDIITLNEIPNSFRSEMTNWMTAFFPTYHLAISPGTDGVLRSGVISRFPFVRSDSWLTRASLTNFGYDGTYTRDLFEAEIAVPGATESLHVFTTHLKSAADADSQRRRAAECSAVSNFFATVFLATNASRPYLLTGDLNEDIDLPMSQNLQAIQRLTNNTGLKLTTPLNPFTLLRFTHSIQGSMDARFDYVMPAGVLASNIVTAQVFRTDLLLPPLPSDLNSDDDVVASDHLPVVMVFRYPDPPLRTALSVSNQTVTLTWPALVGRQFQIESSTNLATWTVVASSVSASNTQPALQVPAVEATQFYRVVRLP